MEETIQYLQIATNIIIIILYIGLVIMVINLIKNLKSVTSKFEELSSQVKDVKAKVEPVIEKIQNLTANVNTVVDRVKDNIDVLEKVVWKVKDTADNIIEFEQKVQRKIEPPVLETVNTIAAVSVGIKTFFDVLKKRKNKAVYTTDSDDQPDYIKDSIEDVNKELEEVNAKLTDLQK